MAYLSDNPPAVQQWYETRNRPLTGCTVLHTAEGVLDSIGPDTGAEATAEFIRTRTTAGSYHDLVDSDSWVPLIAYEHGAFHDATGSNNWALSISFACRTSDWRAMSPEKRRGFLRQGARAFAAQQAWRKAHGFPLTELRLITKAQSDAGLSGFTYHGYRDPSRRTDPGVAAPDLFPFDEWIDECRKALAGEGDWFDMASIEDLVAVLRSEGVSGAGDPNVMMDRGYRQALYEGTAAVLRSEGVSGAADTGRLVDALTDKLAAAPGSAAGSLTREDIVAAVREVFADAAA